MTINAETIREAIQKLHDDLEAEIDGVMDGREDGYRETATELETERAGVVASLIAVNATIADMPIGSKVKLKDYNGANDLPPGVVVHPREVQDAADDYTAMIPVRWYPGDKRENTSWEYIEDLKPVRA